MVAVTEREPTPRRRSRLRRVVRGENERPKRAVRFVTVLRAEREIRVVSTSARAFVRERENTNVRRCRGLTGARIGIDLFRLRRGCPPDMGSSNDLTRRVDERQTTNGRREKIIHVHYVIAIFE